ncbi:hypothetical protein OAG80_00230, partial [Akkermansiaceae bacterium]|nr:hypothetical protein [Akkermansiaceae bacterium]
SDSPSAYRGFSKVAQPKRSDAMSTKSLTRLASPFIFHSSMKFIPLMTRKAIEKAILLYLFAHIIFFLIYTVKVGQMMGFFGGM